MTDSIRITEYGNWFESDLRCPKCGEQAMWRNDEHDYYNGFTFACTECRTFWLSIEQWDPKNSYMNAERDQDAIMDAITEFLWSEQ